MGPGPDDVAGRHFTGSGAVERGERRGGAEPDDGPDPGEDLACQLGADAVELGECAPGLGERDRRSHKARPPVTGRSSARADAGRLSARGAPVGGEG
jgi:hypothetical protein